MSDVIKMKKIVLEWQISEEQLKAYGGVKNYKELLYDIFERYAYDEYFDFQGLQESGVCEFPNYDKIIAGRYATS